MYHLSFCILLCLSLLVISLSCQPDDDDENSARAPDDPTATGNKHKAKKVKRTPSNINEKDPKSLSVEEWCKLSKEVMVLFCNSHNLVSSGSTSTLASRLFDHFNPTGSSGSVHAHSISAVPLTTTNSTSTTFSRAASLPDFSALNGSSEFSSIICQEIRNVLSTTDLTSHFGRIPTPLCSHDQIPNHQNSVPPSSAQLNFSRTLPTLNQAGAYSLPPQPNLMLNTENPQLANDYTLTGHPFILPHLHPANTDLTSNLPTDQQTPHLPATSTAGISPDTNPLLPSIPQSVTRQIDNGEFINFDLLLPAYFPPPVESLNEQPQAAATLNTGEFSRPRVQDFHRWLSAWNTYLRTVTMRNPLVTQQMLYYQAHICRLASRFNFRSWYSYDRAFRYRLANNRHLRWDHFDEETYISFIHSAEPLPSCYHCSNPGHLANNCPSRADTQPFRAHQHPTNAYNPSESQSQNREENQSLPCHSFNGRGLCTNPTCSYAHSCIICGSNRHGAKDCTKRFKRK